MTRMLIGYRDLEEAKEVLCAFETLHVSNTKHAEDIRQHLFWDKRTNTYQVDAGFMLRGETEVVRIYEAKGEWLDDMSGKVVAHIKVNERHYFFTIPYDVAQSR